MAEVVQLESLSPLIDSKLETRKLQNQQLVLLLLLLHPKLSPLLHQLPQLQRINPPELAVASLSEQVVQVDLSRIEANLENPHPVSEGVSKVLEKNIIQKITEMRLT